MRIRFLATTVAILILVPALRSQKVSGGTDTDRRASTVIVSSDESGPLAGVSIGYTPPEWRDSYDGMLKQLGGNYMRLGKGWWTTFDTIGTVEIGGTKIEAGSYYLGLSVGKDGAFSLLVFDSRQMMKSRLLPAATSLYRGDVRAETKAPLTFAQDSLKETVVKLEIEITADEKDPTTGRLSIRWGKHELSAPVKFHLGRAEEGDKK